MSSAHNIFTDKQMIEGIYVLRTPVKKAAGNGNEYLLFTLTGNNISIACFAWLERYTGILQLRDNMLVSVIGTIHWNNYQWTADIIDIEEVVEATIKKTPTIQHTDDITACNIDKFNYLANSVANHHLNRLLLDFIADKDLNEQFMTYPASEWYHHAYQGGLFTHSIETANIVSQHMEFQQDIRELGIVAALLHDVGKIKTLSSKQRPLAGYVLDHDSLTLELLKSHLSKLDRSWEEGSIALRYLLTYTTARKKPTSPILTIAEAVVAADRISTGLDRELRYIEANQTDSSMLLRRVIGQSYS